MSTLHTRFSAFITFTAMLANAAPATVRTKGGATAVHTRRAICDTRLSATGWTSPDGALTGTNLFHKGGPGCDGIQMLVSNGTAGGAPSYTKGACLDKVKYQIDPQAAFSSTSTPVANQKASLRVFYYGLPETIDNDQGRRIYGAAWTGSSDSDVWADYTEAHGFNHFVKGADPKHLAATTYLYKSQPISSVFYIQDGWLKEMTRDADGNNVEWTMYGNGFQLNKTSSNGDNESTFLLDVGKVESVDAILDLQAMTWVNPKNGIVIKAVYLLDGQNKLHEFTWRSTNPHADLQPSGFMFEKVASFSVSHIYLNSVEPHARLFIQPIGSTEIKQYWDVSKIVRDVIPWVEDLDATSLDVTTKAANSVTVTDASIKVNAKANIAAAFQPGKGWGSMSVFYTDENCSVRQSYRNGEAQWVKKAPTVVDKI